LIFPREKKHFVTVFFSWSAGCGGCSLRVRENMVKKIEKMPGGERVEVPRLSAMFGSRHRQA